MRVAVIDSRSLVVNVAEAEADWDAGGGLTVVPSDTADIGDTYDGTNFIPPPPPPLEEAPPSQAEVVLLDHENRLRTIEGKPVVTSLKELGV